MDEVHAKKFGVLVPIHKPNDFLYACLDSILSDIPKEVKLYCLIHNPNSEIRDFVRAYQQIARIKVLETTSNSLSGALNYGLMTIEEEWVFRMDSDDIWLKGRFLLQSKMLEEFPECFVFSGGMEVINSLNQSSYELSYREVRQLHLEDLLNEAMISHPTVLFNRARILALGGYNENYKAAEDYELWSRVASTQPIVVSPKKLIRYRVHTESQSIRLSDMQSKETNHTKIHILLMLARIKPYADPKHNEKDKKCLKKIRSLKFKWFLRENSEYLVELNNALSVISE